MKRSPLQEEYEKKHRAELQKKFDIKNSMEIPKLSKIVVSMGLADASKDKKLIEHCTEALTLLTAQKPLLTKSRKSISNFKLREGQIIGAKVTLRGHRMYDFMYKLTNICVPRVADFRGLNRKADGKGSYSFGLKDQTIFPEIDLDKMKYSQGMNITFVTSAKSNDECLELLTLMGLPLKPKK